jgi:hypothetical protein
VHLGKIRRSEAVIPGRTPGTNKAAGITIHRKLHLNCRTLGNPIVKAHFRPVPATCNTRLTSRPTANQAKCSPFRARSSTNSTPTNSNLSTNPTEFTSLNTSSQSRRSLWIPTKFCRASTVSWTLRTTNFSSNLIRLHPLTSRTICQLTTSHPTMVEASNCHPRATVTNRRTAEWQVSPPANLHHTCLKLNSLSPALSLSKSSRF